MKHLATKLPTALALGLSLAGVSACQPHGRNTTKLQYMPDMADAPTTKAQESTINPPDDSVTINALLYPESLEKGEQELQSPYGQGAQVPADILAGGKVMYETYCLVCHGPDGKGKGPLGDAYPVPVPDISRPDLATHKDGFFFMRITNGGNMMPAYAYAISPHERWQLITYLRTLQQQPK